MSRSLTLAFVVSILLVVALPRAAAAAPPAATATEPASAATTGVCALTGVVGTDGTRCPGNDRLRRQIPGISSPLPYPTPVNIIGKVAGGATNAFGGVALTLVGGWVASGAESALKETAKVIGASTKPDVTSSWFSASYWKIAAIAALLTLPFLCAAAVHALVRSELGLLTRAAFGYLPLSLLAVGIASQLTMLLLSATDEMSSIVSTASGNADATFLARTAVEAIAASVGGGDAFVGFLAAIITVAAALTLWVELLVRDAAVYVIVLMLPLFFAAMVWPARRTLAIRAVETLIALILSKFAIIAVLTLGGAALGHSSVTGPAQMLIGATLVLLAAFSPWALLRMLPLHEVASAAAGSLSQGLRQSGVSTERRMALAALGADGVERLLPRMQSGARSVLFDGSRFGDAHRSAVASEPDPAPDPVEPPGAGADLEPVAAGTAGEAISGGVSAGSDVDGTTDDRPSQQPSSSPSGAGRARDGEGDPGGGDPGRRDTPGGDPGAAPTGIAGLAAGDAGASGAAPDGERSPFVLPPDLPVLQLSEQLGNLADRGLGIPSGEARRPGPGSHEGPPLDVVVEPPPLAEDDRIAPAPTARDPVGPPTPPPPGHGPEPPSAGDGEHAG
jgi:hypothetical protein